MQIFKRAILNSSLKKIREFTWKIDIRGAYRYFNSGGAAMAFDIRTIDFVTMVFHSNSVQETMEYSYIDFKIEFDLLARSGNEKIFYENS